MNDPSSAYGLWSLAVIDSAVFIFFAFSFFKPRSKRDWRTRGLLSAYARRTPAFVPRWTVSKVAGLAARNGEKLI